MHRPVAYIYEADYHCTGCTTQRFGTIPTGAEDREGNLVDAVFSWQDFDLPLTCGDCLDIIAEGKNGVLHVH